MANSVTPQGVELEQGRSAFRTLSPCQPLSLPRMGQVVPVWLRVWSIVTAVSALPLVTLGAEVTTKRVGMVDPKGFRAPWHLFTAPGEVLSQGYLIEHGHRLAGYVVGTAAIVLALGLAIQARGWLHRSIGIFALVMVSLQGLLGIFRVDLNALMGSWLALVHGCFAQLVFATLVGVAVLCSRAWNDTRSALPSTERLWAIGLCVLIYVQVVFGAMMRHLTDPLAQRLHILLAFAVLLAVFGMAVRLHAQNVDRPTRRIGYLLVGLVVLQPILGVEAWVRRFGSGELPELVPSSPTLDIVRSGHHVLGTLIFATSVALVAMLCRRVVIESAVSEHRLEGTA